MKIEFTNVRTKQSFEKFYNIYSYKDYANIIKDWIKISNDEKDPLYIKSDKDMMIFKENVVDYTIRIKEEYYTFDNDVKKIKKIRKSGIEYFFNKHEKIRLIIIGISFTDYIHTKNFPISFTTSDDLEIFNDIGNKAIKNENIDISFIIKKHKINNFIIERFDRLSRSVEVVKSNWNELECNNK